MGIYLFAEVAVVAMANAVPEGGNRWPQLSRPLRPGCRSTCSDVEASAGQIPPIDLDRHQGTVIGEAAAVLLKDVAGPDGTAAKLTKRYGTDVSRRSVLLSWRGSQVSFDRGRLVVSTRSLPICELKLELKLGDAATLSKLDAPAQPVAGSRVQGRTGAAFCAAAYALSESNAKPRTRTKLQRCVRPVLQRLYRDVVRNGKRFTRLSEDAQHAVRKELKRLRYVSEFVAPLYDENRRRALPGSAPPGAG